MRRCGLCRLYARCRAADGLRCRRLRLRRCRWTSGCSPSSASNSAAAFLAESPGQWWTEWAAPWICCQLACSGMCGVSSRSPNMDSISASRKVCSEEPLRTRLATMPAGDRFGREFLPEQLDGPHGALRAGHREEPGLGHQRHLVAGGPRHPGQAVQGRRAVDEDQFVVPLHRPAQRRAGEGRGGPGPAGRRCRCRPSRRRRPGRRPAPEPLLGRAVLLHPAAGNHVLGQAARRGDLSIRPMSSCSSGLDAEGRGGIRMGVKVDDEGGDAGGHRRRRQSGGHRCLADTAFEAADADYLHLKNQYLTPVAGTGRAGSCVPDRVGSRAAHTHHMWMPRRDLCHRRAIGRRLASARGGGIRRTAPAMGRRPRGDP